jgi:glycosyltransferase 2 family protein
LFHFLPVARVIATLRRLPPWLYFLVLVGYLAAHTVAVAKWRMMVNLAGAGLDFRQAARSYFSGLFSTLFLPSIVGGDVVRAGLALRFGRNKPGLLLGSFLDRVADLLALAFLSAPAALLVTDSAGGGARRFFLWFGVLVLGTILAVFLAVALLPARRFPWRLRRHLVKLHEGWRSMKRRPHYVAAALILAIVAQGSFVLLTVSLAEATGLHLPLAAWCFAWPLAKLSAVLPISQGGIGVREAALAALLVPLGAAPADAVAVGLAWEAIIIAGGLLAGLLAFVLGRAAPLDG